MNHASRLAALLLLVLLATLQVGCSNKMSQAEADAREALRGMGAFASLDVDGIHVGTLMLTAPDILGKMDEAIPLVAELPYLTHLELTNTNLTDEHMKTVRGLRRLKSLVLSGTGIGDEGLKQVASLKIDTLYVDGTEITPAAMDIVGGMTDMKILDISSADVLSNLEPLKKLTSLEWLVLENTEIDSSAVDIIKELASLKRLTIKGSTISPEDLERLKIAKPSMLIDQANEAQADVGAETAENDSSEPQPTQ